MAESISIPISVLRETRQALDAAILSTGDDSEIFGMLVKARANLESVAGNGIGNQQNRDIIRLKRKAKAAIALLHEMVNGLEDAA